MYQLDVKNGFLSGDLQNEFYMEQPPRFVTRGNTYIVCKLKKDIYDLKHFPRAWFDKLSGILLTFGFIQGHFDD